MNRFIERAVGFERTVFPSQSELYNRLATDGQNPKALMISCADSRVVPELILQAGPGDLFVCRNAGNIVPPFQQANGGVSSVIEYAVVALGIHDIIVCGHSDCGAMKALGDHEALAKMPNVAAWLRHSHAACSVVDSAYPELEGADRARALALENIVVQINHLRTHPSVAAAIAKGAVTLHGWFVDIKAGQILGYNGATGRFEVLSGERQLPTALSAEPRLASDFARSEAAE